MFGIPDAAIGGILAAIIAGTISLLGLIISKEQKISDFRQSWIDALRSDLSAYITNLNTIHDSLKVKHDSHAEKVKLLSPLYSLLNSSTFNIQFRINPKEDRSKKVLSSMTKISALLADESKMTSENIKPYEAEFISSSQELLKFEWKRVKSGELTFRIAKFAALALVISGILAVGIIAIHHVLYTNKNENSEKIISGNQENKNNTNIQNIKNSSKNSVNKVKMTNNSDENSEREQK